MLATRYIKISWLAIIVIVSVVAVFFIQEIRMNNKLSEAENYYNADLSGNLSDNRAENTMNNNDEFAAEDIDVNKNVFKFTTHQFQFNLPDNWQAFSKSWSPGGDIYEKLEFTDTFDGIVVFTDQPYPFEPRLNDYISINRINGSYYIEGAEDVDDVWFKYAKVDDDGNEIKRNIEVRIINGTKFIIYDSYGSVWSKIKNELDKDWVKTALFMHNGSFFNVRASQPDLDQAFNELINSFKPLNGDWEEPADSTALLAQKDLRIQDLEQLLESLKNKPTLENFPVHFPPYANIEYIEEHEFISTYGEYAGLVFQKHPEVVTAITEVYKDFDVSTMSSMATRSTKVVLLEDGRKFIIFNGCVPHACGGHISTVAYDVENKNAYALIENYPTMDFYGQSDTEVMKIMFGYFYNEL